MYVASPLTAIFYSRTVPSTSSFQNILIVAVCALSCFSLYRGHLASSNPFLAPLSFQVPRCSIYSQPPVHLKAISSEHGPLKLTSRLAVDSLRPGVVDCCTVADQELAIWGDLSRFVERVECQPMWLESSPAEPLANQTDITTLKWRAHCKRIVN